MSEAYGSEYYPECPSGLYDKPDIVVDEYVEVEQSATKRVGELAGDVESLETLVRLAQEALQRGDAPDERLIGAIKELLEKIASLGKVTLSDLGSLVERRPEVERAVESASGEVHTGWAGRL